MNLIRLNSLFVYMFLMYHVFVFQLDGNRDQQMELFPAGKNSEPIVIKFDDSTFALIKDSQSVFVNINGTLMSKNAVKWSEVPQALSEYTVVSNFHHVIHLLI